MPWRCRSEGAGPPETLDLLRRSGIAFVIVLDATDGAGVAAGSALDGGARGVPDMAANLAQTIQRERADAQADLPADPARVLFLISVQGARSWWPL